MKKAATECNTSVAAFCVLYFLYKSSGHCYVRVDIYFTAAGMIDIPTEEEIVAMMAEIRENSQEFRFAA